MTQATVAVSPLRRRMIDAMSLRNLSPATQRSYLHSVTKFSRYLADRVTGSDWKMFERSRSSSYRKASPGDP